MTYYTAKAQETFDHISKWVVSKIDNEGSSEVVAEFGAEYIYEDECFHGDIVHLDRDEASHLNNEAVKEEAVNDEAVKDEDNCVEVYFSTKDDGDVFFMLKGSDEAFDRVRDILDDMVEELAMTHARHLANVKSHEVDIEKWKRKIIERSKYSLDEWNAKRRAECQRRIMLNKMKLEKVEIHKDVFLFFKDKLANDAEKLNIWMKFNKTNATMYYKVSNEKNRYYTHGKTLSYKNDYERSLELIQKFAKDRPKECV